MRSHRLEGTMEGPHWVAYWLVRMLLVPNLFWEAWSYSSEL